ncbi:endolytic transglycosylase MltG [Rhizobium alvei]|uniref:Endolytic murein transglycosylase n=1 Tax=Rhizobium alvei TaxID=1132659 RepID=A0ABT8YJ31_9HYPH|nr:endolytic transglycosylase MltG [Rhizobium alvei]MDO6963672.1 endolytic transglycosylase MltG [Rhizobium alvei]
MIPVSPKEALRPEKVPVPPKRSRKARSQVVIFMNFLMSIVTLVTIAAVVIVVYAFREYQAPGPLETDSNFLVREGAGINEIGNDLERRGIVSQGRIFKLISQHLLDGESLKHGEYAIKAHSSMLEVMELLRSGKSIQYSVTIPEGLTVKQIFRRLAENDVLEGDLPVDLPPEGSLRPDTYKFTRGSRRTTIVDQMKAAQARLIDEVWENRDTDLPIKDKSELVTLASIVEKETGKADERPQVASVFINRLNKGMRLQSDPTILYGLFGGEGRPEGREILRSDIDKETPFNTYVIKGLPPTPIANPGKAALQAVANPSKTKYLYFVADGTGGHVFAETLDDHNANVKRWRKLEAERKANEAKAAEEGQTTEPAQQPSQN